VGNRVLGVDACRAGWVGVVLDDTGVTAYAAPIVAGLVTAARVAGELAVVAIDIPIGLPDRGRRRADLLARRVVGPRRAPSVFITPARPALRAHDHADAVRTNRELTGDGISIQAFGLRARILEVDRWVRGYAGRVVEVHPEVSFATMAGAPLVAGKTTWSGVEQRRQLLAGSGVPLAGDLGAAGALAGVDDVLDATAAAWSARRVAAGTAVLLPDPPEVFSDGWPAAISA
jgi:predicted RNase H-like nuclease